MFQLLCRYNAGCGCDSLLGDLADVVEGVRASLQGDVVPRRDFLPTLSKQGGLGTVKFARVRT